MKATPPSTVYLPDTRKQVEYDQLCKVLTEIKNVLKHRIIVGEEAHKSMADEFGGVMPHKDIDELIRGICDTPDPAKRTFILSSRLRSLVLL